MAAKKTPARASSGGKAPVAPVVHCIVVLKTHPGLGRKGELRNFAEATLEELGVKRGEHWRKATPADKALGRVTV